MVVGRLRKYSDTLSANQLRVLKLVAEGTPNKRIGIELGISANYARKIVSTIYAKLGAVDRANAVYIAMRRGLIK